MAKTDPIPAYFAADAPPRSTLDGQGTFRPQTTVIPHVRRILEIARHLDQWRDRIEESDLIALTEEVTDDMQLLNVALDMIGVPANRLPNQDRHEKFNPQRHFSRDIYNALYEVTVFEHNDVETFLEIATGGRPISDRWDTQEELSRLIYGDEPTVPPNEDGSMDLESEPEGKWDSTSQTFTLTQEPYSEPIDLRSINTERDLLGLVVRLNALPWMSTEAVTLAVNQIADLLGFQV